MRESALVMSRGKRFESARRLLLFPRDKPKTLRKKKALTEVGGLLTLVQALRLFVGESVAYLPDGAPGR